MPEVRDFLVQARDTHKKSCNFVKKIRINILLHYAPALIWRITGFFEKCFLQEYPGCQRLFMRGFRFRSSLKKTDPRLRFACGRRSSSSHARKKPLIPRLLLEWIPVKAWQTGKNRKTSQKIRVKLAMSRSCPTLKILPSARAKTSKAIFCTRNKAILTLESKIMQLL